MTPEETPISTRRLTPQHERFCIEYLFDSNGSAAARRAGISPGMAGKRAHEWLKWPEIQARIAELGADRIARLKADSDTQLRDMIEMLRVDTNELVEFRRVNCRHCWGVDHRHQWNSVEVLEAQEKWEGYAEATKAGRQPPNFAGGSGFNPWKAPNPKCPVCGGNGEGRAYFHDTRTLTPAARRLYEGVHVGRDGTKMVVVDRATLIDKVNRGLGLYKDKVELTGKDGGPIQTVTETMTVKEAAAAYADTLNNSSR